MDLDLAIDYRTQVDRTDGRLAFLLPRTSYSTLLDSRTQSPIMSAKADVKLNDFKNLFSLQGKVAVVTGGSRGLGLHAASG